MCLIDNKINLYKKGINKLLVLIKTKQFTELSYYTNIFFIGNKYYDDSYYKKKEIITNADDVGIAKLLYLLINTKTNTCLEIKIKGVANMLMYDNNYMFIDPSRIDIYVLLFNDDDVMRPIITHQYKYYIPYANTLLINEDSHKWVNLETMRDKFNDGLISPLLWSYRQYNYIKIYPIITMNKGTIKQIEYDNIIIKQAPGVLGRILGKGKIGKVYNHKTDKTQVIKVIQIHNFRNILNEYLVNILINNNKNLIKMRSYEFVLKKGLPFLYLYMDKCIKCITMTDIIFQHCNFDKCTMALKIMEIVDLLCIMHKQHIYHRDISCNNIMIHSALKEIYLIDFGRAIYTEDDINREYERINVNNYTPHYSMPDYMHFIMRYKNISKYKYFAYHDLYAICILMRDLGITHKIIIDCKIYNKTIAKIYKYFDTCI